MAKKDRTGNRKSREQRKQFKVPELGYYLIVTDTEAKVGWSNPCFEIWMYAYFGAMPAIQDSWTCCSDFGRVYENKTGQKYSKADEQMYGKLCKSGDEEKAIQIAQQKLDQCIREGKTKPSEMCPCTTVHELVGEIRKKQ
ncbi:MAG: RloB domain-containing protein [Oliverpabstia sp.]